MNTLGPNIKNFAKAGATNYFPEGNSESNGGELAELKTYIITKLLWDPTTNDTALIEEFVSGYYGAAGPSVQEYVDAFAEAAGPSAGGTGEERRFLGGACVNVADRPWATGGKGVITLAHPDGTYNVNLTAVNRTDVVSWVYIEPCKPSPGALRGKMLVDMAAESCDVMQNGTHSGWACGYLTPNATMRGLRAMLAAAAAPGLTTAQAARVARSSLPITYLTLVKWEELEAWVAVHTDQGGWPLSSPKEDVFAKFVVSLKTAGVTNLWDHGKWTLATLHDKIFGK